MSCLSYSQQEFNFNEYNKKCGDLFRYIELNHPNYITLIYKKEKGPTYLTNHPTDHLQYSNNIVAKTDPTAPRTIVIIVDKIRVKTGLLFTKSKI